MDFVIMLFDKSNFILSIGFFFWSVYFDVFLNGLEIMKMNNFWGSFVGVFILLMFLGFKKNLGVIVSVSVGVLFVLVMIGLFFFMYSSSK